MSEIIIDGIDVSKCKNFVFNEVNENNNCFNEAELHINCKYNLNCYFKQLQRAKAELQEAQDNYVKLDLERVEQNKKLLAENECLKEKLQISQNSDKETLRILQENERLKEEIIKLTEENGNLIINRNTTENKLQDTESRLISIQKVNTHNLVLLQRRNNALDEIREIADLINKANCNSVKESEKILDKISEVLND